MVEEGRQLEKDGGLEQSLKVRGLGADYRKVRGRMGGVEAADIDARTLAMLPGLTECIFLMASWHLRTGLEKADGCLRKWLGFGRAGWQEENASLQAQYSQGRTSLTSHLLPYPCTREKNR